jgi:hypothetical protein
MDFMVVEPPDWDLVESSYPSGPGAGCKGGYYLIVPADVFQASRLDGISKIGTAVSTKV